jgi:hypothetical protein
MCDLEQIPLTYEHSLHGERSSCTVLLGNWQLFARSYAIDAEPGLSCFAQVRLHCAESRLDRIEVGRVRRQIEQRGRWVGQLDI